MGHWFCSVTKDGGKRQASFCQAVPALSALPTQAVVYGTLALIGNKEDGKSDRVIIMKPEGKTLPAFVVCKAFSLTNMVPIDIISVREYRKNNRF